MKILLLTIPLYMLATSSHQITVINEPSPTPLTQVVHKTMTVTASGYSSEESQTDSSPNITAHNTEVRDGIIANNCLAFGTNVELNGKTYVVEDRMNKRYGCNQIDIWFPDKQTAIEWGVKTVQIKIIK